MPQMKAGIVTSELNSDTVVAVAHAEDDLGSSVVACDDVGCHHEAGAGRTRQTKVKNLECTVALDDDVGRLQILQQQQSSRSAHCGSEILLLTN